MVVEAIGNDLRVRTEVSQSKPPKRSSAARPLKPKPAKAVCNKGSRTRLRNAVRGIYEAASFLTLTFPKAALADEPALRRAWDRLRRWLLVKGASGVMTIEFTEAGRPHLHVVVDAAISNCELAAEWGRILGVEDERTLDRAVRSCWVYAQRRLASYMAKSAQKEAPAGFVVTRWWSSFGKEKPARPKLVARAPRTEMSGLLRALWSQRPGGMPPRTANGEPPPRFWVPQGVDLNWQMLVALGIVAQG